MHRRAFCVVWLTIIRDYNLVISVQYKTGDDEMYCPNPLLVPSLFSFFFFFNVLVNVPFISRPFPLFALLPTFDRLFSVSNYSR